LEAHSTNGRRRAEGQWKIGLGNGIFHTLNRDLMICHGRIFSNQWLDQHEYMRKITIVSESIFKSA
jgi:hypothetical protein